MKKRIVSLVLATVMLLTVVTTCAFANFDKSVFQNSRKFNRLATGGWMLTGMYIQNYSEAEVRIYEVLDDECIKNGTGPKLIFTYFDKEMDTYNTVTSFKAEVDNLVFEFSDLLIDDERASDYEDVLITDEYSYMYCGKTAKQFLKVLGSAKEISFYYTHEDIFGDETMSYDQGVHTGSVSQLVDVSEYLKKSDAWSTIDDLEAIDSDFNAVMSKLA